MGVTVNTSNNRADNSNRLSATNGNNNLVIGGNIGGGNRQGIKSQNSGSLDLKVPVSAFLVLDDVQIVDASNLNLGLLI